MTMSCRSWASEPHGAPTILPWGWGNDTKATKDEMAEDERAETLLFVVTAISWDVSCCWRSDTHLHVFRWLVRIALQRTHAWEGRAALVWPVCYAGQTVSWRTWVRTLVYSCNRFWDYCSLTVPPSVTCFRGNSARLKGSTSHPQPFLSSLLMPPCMHIMPSHPLNGRKVIKFSPIQQCVLKIMSSIWDIVFQLIYKNIPWG